MEQIYKMTEEKKEHKLTLSSKGKLTLKNRENSKPAGKKGVKVEVRKKRIITSGGESSSKKSLDKETAMKLKLLQEAKELEAKKAKELEAKRKKEEAKKTETKKQKESKAKTKKDNDYKKKSETRPSKKFSAPVEPVIVEQSKSSKSKKSTTTKPNKEETFEEIRKKSKTKNSEQKRRGSNKISIQDFSEDGEFNEGYRRKKRKKKKEPKVILTADKKIIKEVTIPETIIVQELANRMAEKSATVIKVLMGLGVMATINQPIDADTAQLVVEELGHKFKRVSEDDIESKLLEDDDEAEDIRSRAPVVTVMGHVDHGKTSLLDALRETNVADREAGGITQHIGAYQINLESGSKITFIDTPGHEAFSEMRSRGAQVTDIVVLVVAANDGIMPQTIEAIRHAQAAGVPIVVAINKIDLPGADPLRVKTELLNHGIAVEEMGGEVLSAEVSAKKRTNIKGLLEAIVLQAEILELKANHTGKARGAVVESRMEKGRGAVATVLVQKGILDIGDICVCGKEWGKVKAMLNDNGERIQQAFPGTPVEVIGLQGTPGAGDDLVEVETEAQAREITDHRIRKEKEAKIVKSAKSAMEQLLDKIKSGETKDLPIIIKADVQGSVEALEGTLNKLSTDEVKVSVLHSAVGGINESDVTLAKASGAFIIGFNVRANPQARDMAKQEEVDIRYYSIIYDVANDVKKALEGMLAPELKEKITGYAQIREVFNISSIGKVGGCMVTEGIVKRGAKVRLLRDNVVIHDGNLGQLKRFKDDVKEVKEGYECGMSFENYNDIQVNDYIECYEIEEIAATLD
jgi:translation initiation factor IF-2